jgi:subtilisin family serine protease
MKYIIVKRRNPILGMKRSDSKNTFRYTLTTEELDEKDVSKLRAGHGIEGIIPVLAFHKVEPPKRGEHNAAASGIMGGVAWGVRAVNAVSASNLGEGVKVAVLDTGVDTTHPAFRGVNFLLRDFTLDDTGVPGVAADIDGHGTHVAATIFGRDIDGTRIGVATGIKDVLVGKVLSPNGASFVALKCALDWAVNNHADVICMSLGIDFPSAVRQFREDLDLPEDIAVSRVLDAYRRTMRLYDTYAASLRAQTESQGGALLIAASGNKSRRDENIRFTVDAAPPAAADGVISVGAVANTGDTFQIAPFSNTGCEFVGPGVSVLSAQLGAGLRIEHGTSMAAPHVAGVAALWTRHEFPDGDRRAGWAERVRSRLRSSARAFEAPFESIGFGVVQAPQPVS